LASDAGARAEAFLSAPDSDLNSEDWKDYSKRSGANADADANADANANADAKGFGPIAVGKGPSHRDGRFSGRDGDAESQSDSDAESQSDSDAVAARVAETMRRGERSYEDVAGRYRDLDA
jgi:hypothetical protein